MIVQSTLPRLSLLELHKVLILVSFATFTRSTRMSYMIALVLMKRPLVWKLSWVERTSLVVGLEYPYTALLLPQWLLSPSAPDPSTFPSVSCLVASLAGCSSLSHPETSLTATFSRSVLRSLQASSLAPWDLSVEATARRFSASVPWLSPVSL